MCKNRDMAIDGGFRALTLMRAFMPAMCPQADARG